MWAFDFRDPWPSCWRGKRFSEGKLVGIFLKLRLVCFSWARQPQLHVFLKTSKQTNYVRLLVITRRGLKKEMKLVCGITPELRAPSQLQPHVLQRGWFHTVSPGPVRHGLGKVTGVRLPWEGELHLSLSRSEVSQIQNQNALEEKILDWGSDFWGVRESRLNGPRYDWHIQPPRCVRSTHVGSGVIRTGFESCHHLSTQEQVMPSWQPSVFSVTEGM